jgi:hypothetical protein
MPQSYTILCKSDIDIRLASMEIERAIGDEMEDAIWNAIEQIAQMKGPVNDYNLFIPILNHRPDRTTRTLKTEKIWKYDDLGNLSVISEKHIIVPRPNRRKKSELTDLQWEELWKKEANT